LTYGRRVVGLSTEHHGCHGLAPGIGDSGGRVLPIAASVAAMMPGTSR
jgi:hypothetical protein